jgi:hypothetical protein
MLFGALEVVFRSGVRPPSEDCGSLWDIAIRKWGGAMIAASLVLGMVLALRS